jgi:hypothetical protein
MLEHILTLPTTYRHQDLHYIEENHKVPKGKTKMLFGEVIYSTAQGVQYSRRNICGNQM